MIFKYWLNCTVSFEDISSIVEDTSSIQIVHVIFRFKNPKFCSRALTLCEATPYPDTKTKTTIKIYIQANEIAQKFTYLFGVYRTEGQFTCRKFNINSFEGMGLYGRPTFSSFLPLNHTQSIPVGFDSLLTTMNENTRSTIPDIQIEYPIYIACISILSVGRIFQVKHVYLFYKRVV